MQCKEMKMPTQALPRSSDHRIMYNRPEPARYANIISYLQLVIIRHS